MFRAHRGILGKRVMIGRKTRRLTHEHRANISAATRLAMADPAVRAKVVAANSRRGQSFKNRRRDKVQCVQCAFLAEPRYLELEPMTDGSKQWQCISVKACEKRRSATEKHAEHHGAERDRDNKGRFLCGSRDKRHPATIKVAA
jgi:hypothetical protein